MSNIRPEDKEWDEKPIAGPGTAPGTGPGTGPDTGPGTLSREVYERLMKEQEENSRKQKP